MILAEPRRPRLQDISGVGGSSSPKWNVRESYSNISRKLGVDEETVRMRVNRAKERGFLPAWRVMVNPLLINCQEANLDLEVRNEQDKGDAISRSRVWMELMPSSIFATKKFWLWCTTKTVNLWQGKFNK